MNAIQRMRAKNRVVVTSGGRGSYCEDVLTFTFSDEVRIGRKGIVVRDRRRGMETQLLRRDVHVTELESTLNECLKQA